MLETLGWIIVVLLIWWFIVDFHRVQEQSHSRQTAAIKQEADAKVAILQDELANKIAQFEALQAELEACPKPKIADIDIFGFCSLARENGFEAIIMPDSWISVSKDEHILRLDYAQGKDHQAYITDYSNDTTHAAEIVRLVSQSAN